MDGIQITFRGIDKSEPLETYIRQRIGRLQRLCNDLTSCSVAIERPHRHETSGNPYRVRIHCELPPGREIVVVKDEGDHPLNDSLRVVINDAFKAASRQIKDTLAQRRHEVKHHDEPRGIVVRKFDERGYGFLQALDGREIYFHENAVHHGDFRRVHVGAEVRFAESLGEKGPQASSVQIINQPSGKR